MRIDRYPRQVFHDQKLAIDLRHPERSYRGDAGEKGFEASAKSGDIAFDDQVADVAFAHHDTEAPAGKILRRRQGDNQVVPLPGGTLDALQQGLDIKQRDLLADQALPEKGECRWIERGHAHDIDGGQPESGLGQAFRRNAGDWSGDPEPDGRRPSERRTVLADDRVLVCNDLARPGDDRLVHGLSDNRWRGDYQARHKNEAQPAPAGQPPAKRSHHLQRSPAPRLFDFTSLTDGLSHGNQSVAFSTGKSLLTTSKFGTSIFGMIVAENLVPPSDDALVLGRQAPGGVS